MPERIFKYDTTPQLFAAAAALSTALKTGATQELRNNHTGFLKTTGPLTPEDLRRAQRDVRFEIFLRGLGKGINLPDAEIAQCAAAEPTNPLQERVMRVETINCQ